MSSQNQPTSETAPLLGDSGLAGRERFRFSPGILLIPVVLATKLGNVITSTTLIELLRQTVCRLSNTSRGDIASLDTPELCDAPEIARDFATVIAILSATQGIICMFVILSAITVVGHKYSSDY